MKTKCARKGCDHDSVTGSIFCSIDKFIAKPSDSCDNLPVVKDEAPAAKDNEPAWPTTTEYMKVVDALDEQMNGQSSLVCFVALTTLCRVKAMGESAGVRKLVASALRKAANEISPETHT
jgi:hypothetical protein